MFDLMEDSRLHVEAALDEADIGRVAIGQPASLRLDALSGHAIRGHVSKLDPTVRKDDKGARSLTVEVEIDDVAAARAAGVRPGMSANVDIRVAEKPDVPNLPSNVIVGAGAKRTVYRIQDGRARQVPVRVGLASWDRSEILSGLAEGDQVIATLNAKGLVDGAAVVTSKAGGR
jgi:HlyD family secretion protein